MPSEFLVMDFSRLSTLIPEILRAVPCPKCRASLENAELDVLSADSESLAFQLECPQCESRLTMEGLLRQREEVPALEWVEGRHRLLSPDSVRGISEQLHNFRGSDIRELLGR